MKEQKQGGEGQKSCFLWSFVLQLAWFPDVLPTPPLENDVWLCDHLFVCSVSVCMEGYAGPDSALYAIHQAMLKDTKTKPRPSCALTIILIPLLKARGLGFVGELASGVDRAFPGSCSCGSNPHLSGRCWTLWWILIRSFSQIIQVWLCQLSIRPSSEDNA